MQVQQSEAQQHPSATQPSGEPEEEVTRGGRFCGSPASHFFVALIFTLIHITIYLKVQNNFLAAVGGLTICDVLILLFLVAYASSLHRNATFSQFLAFRCVGQAFLSGLILGVPIALSLYNFEEWRTGAYFCAVWVITLVFWFFTTSSAWACGSRNCRSGDSR